MLLTRVLAADDTGTLVLSWFNAPYVAEHLEPGKSYYFEGRIGGALTRRERSCTRPSAPRRKSPASPLVPVYPSTEGLPQRPHCQGGGGGAGRCRRPAGAGCRRNC